MKIMKKGCESKLEINIKIYNNYHNLKNNFSFVFLFFIRKFKFGNIQVEKRAFHKSKYLICINEEDIAKIVISDIVSYVKKGFKIFIGYKDVNKIKTLCIMLPKMSEYFKRFEETKHMSFFD